MSMINKDDYTVLVNIPGWTLKLDKPVVNIQDAYSQCGTIFEPKNDATNELVTNGSLSVDQTGSDIRMTLFFDAAGD